MNSFVRRASGKARRTLAPYVASLRGGSHAAIIGCGRIAPTHIGAYRESGLVNVGGICDVSASSLGATLDQFPGIRAFRDINQMFDEVRPEVVSICTWPQSHRELVEFAIDRGVRGIMCEKPLALMMREVNEMLQLCSEANVKLAGGHQYRFHPVFVRARDIIASGSLGQIDRAHGTIKSNLANNGPHLFDTIRYVFDDREIRSVSCSCVREQETYDRDTPVEEAADGYIVFDDGVRVDFATGSKATEFFQIEITGSSGWLRATPNELILNGNRVIHCPPQARGYRRKQFGTFVRWANEKLKDYPADGLQSAKSNELVLALYESARINSELRLPLENDGQILVELFGETSQSEETANALTLNEIVPKSKALAIDGGKRAVTSWFENRPHIGRDEWKGVAKVLASGNLNAVSGNVVKKFESELAESFSVSGAVASSSGTASIHLALGILGLEPGDEVITTPITDMGTIIPILWCNAVPVFADIDGLTGNLTAESIRDKISDRTRAVILVHLFGRGADVQPIKELCTQRGIVLIEDCSQAHLASVGGRSVGTVGEFGCFSLQQAKQITCGDGGFTLINRESDLHRARLFVDKGWNRRGGSRAHEFLGMNYRMSELQGAVALAQFRKLPKLIAARRRSAELLLSELQTIPGIIVPPASDENRPAWWIFNFMIDEHKLGISSDHFVELLQSEGVRARRNYLPRPIFEEDVLKHRITYGTSGFPYSISSAPAPDATQMPGLEQFMNRQIVISWSSRVADAQARQIADAVRKCAGISFASGDSSGSLARDTQSQYS